MTCSTATRLVRGGAGVRSPLCLLRHGGDGQPVAWGLLGVIDLPLVEAV